MLEQSSYRVLPTTLSHFNSLEFKMGTKILSMINWNTEVNWLKVIKPELKTKEENYTLYWGSKCHYVQSVQFSRSVMSSSLRPHESQHARPPCPSPSPGVHSDSCPSSQWCHPAISSSAIPFSSCPQSLPASVFSNESTLRMKWPKYWSFSLSIIPSKEIPGLISFRMDWLDLLAVQGKESSSVQEESSPTPQHNSSVLSLFHSPTLTSIHDHRKNHSLD